MNLIFFRNSMTFQQKVVTDKLSCDFNFKSTNWEYGLLMIPMDKVFGTFTWNYISPS